MERLRRASLFQRTFAGRKSISSSLLTLYVLPRQARSTPNLPLVGFVAGKKVHPKAVHRNRAKRRVREAYRRMRDSEPSLKQWYSMVFVLHNNAVLAEWQEIHDTVRDCIVQASKKYGTKIIRAN